MGQTVKDAMALEALVARLTANVEELENGVDAGVAIIDRQAAEIERLRGLARQVSGE